MAGKPSKDNTVSDYLISHARLHGGYIHLASLIPTLRQQGLISQTSTNSNAQRDILKSIRNCGAFVQIKPQGATGGNGTWKLKEFCV